MTADHSVLVVGFSGRAAAASLRRAGFQPYIIDCFADRDTQRFGPTLCCPIENFPDAVVGLAQQLAKMPTVFAGGMEHTPNMMLKLGASKPYSDFVSYSRNLFNQPNNEFRHESTLVQLPLAFPSAQDVKQLDDSDILILMKPARGGGGVGIRFAAPGEEPPPGYYLQPYYQGKPYSTVYLRRGFESHFWGMTRQLCGERWLHAEPFKYCGSITLQPTESEREQETYVTTWAHRVARGFKFYGLYGIDFLMQTGLPPCILEINPRYTASIEVLEHATGRAIFNEHVTVPPPPGVVAKAIYYAPFDVVIMNYTPFDDAIDTAMQPWSLPEYADLPRAGECIASGQPVVTMLTRQTNEENCLAELRRRAAELDIMMERMRLT